MTIQEYPSMRTLLVIWLCLIAATVVTMAAGKVTEITSIGFVWAGLLMFVTWLKVILIISYFLNLKAATKNWQQIFIWLTGAIIGVIFCLCIAI